MEIINIDKTYNATQEKSHEELVLSSNILSEVDSPDKLKELNEDQIIILCDEIRQFLIDSITKTGGHLGSNLGIVEVSVALHYAFDFLKDAIIFDVSHQSYVHKILTGRKAEFYKLRQWGGISGFTNKKESDYDKFTFGHAGSSISVALGLAETFKNDRQEEKTSVAVIGDASISSGMSMEALNHLGQTDENVLIILNDNKMSIAPTVGSLSKYLTRTRTAPSYLTFKEKIMSNISRLPFAGKFFYKILHNLKNDIKDTLIPRNMFSDLSIPYYGPVYGHDVITLITTIESLKKKKGPKLLHVYTEKGRGMPNLEKDRTRFHSAPVVGSTKNRDENSDLISYTSNFSDTMVRMGHKYKDLVGITAAMPDGTGLVNFQKEFPDRFYDVGICEQHAIGLASGLATGGKIPVCAIYSTFIQRAYDQIFQEICIQDLPVVIALDRSGLVGNDGFTHHGVFDIAFLRTLPNIILCSPKDNYEFSHMLEFLIQQDHPSAIRYPRGSSTKILEVGKEFQPMKLGKAEIIQEHDKSDVTIMAYGSSVKESINAVSILEKKGYKCNIVNMRFVKPIDKNIIKKFLQKGSPIVTIEEHSIMGGFGSAVLESIAEFGGSNKFKMIGIPDKYITHGNRDELIKYVGLDANSIANKIMEFLDLTL